MKKVIIAIISVAIVMGLFAGCSAAPNSGITYQEILGSFEQQLTSSELGGYYQTSNPSATAILDSDEIRHDLVITDNQAGYVYTLRAWCDPEGYVLGVVLTTTNTEYESLAFSTFCLYMCKALKLSAPDWYAFCETLGLLTNEPCGSTSVDNWSIIAFSSEDMLNLSAFFDPES